MAARLVPVAVAKVVLPDFKTLQILLMKYHVLFFLFFLSSLTVHSQRSLDELLNLFNTRSIPYISVEELRMLQINGEVIILDAREKEEYTISCIPSAEYIGYSKFSSKKVSENIPNKESMIVVYCTLGIRSEKIGEKLKKAGFTNVKNLYGGIFEWKNSGYPVLNLQGDETEKVHTRSRIWSFWLTKGEKVYE